MLKLYNNVTFFNLNIFIIIDKQTLTTTTL